MTKEHRRCESVALETTQLQEEADGFSPCGLRLLRWVLRRGLWSGASSKVRERITVSQRNWAPLISSSRSSSRVGGGSCGCLSLSPVQQIINKMNR